MLLSSTARPASPRRAAKRSARASALPVCEAQSRVTGLPVGAAMAASLAGAPASTRLNSPASMPSSHSRAGVASGAWDGRHGTPSAWLRKPLMKPDSQVRSLSFSTGGVLASIPTCAAKASMRDMVRSFARGEGVASAAGAGVSRNWWSISSTRRRLTALNLNSGCCDSGSMASLVTALIARFSPYTSFQWNGAKQAPGCTRSLTTTGSTAWPRRERISK
ncbi:hypothetical protein D3C78_1052570 [compost metagenome]